MSTISRWSIASLHDVTRGAAAPSKSAPSGHSKAALGARFDLELEIAGAAVDAGSISLPRTAGSWGTRSTAPG